MSFLDGNLSLAQCVDLANGLQWPLEEVSIDSFLTYDSCTTVLTYRKNQVNVTVYDRGDVIIKLFKNEKLIKTYKTHLVKDIHFDLIDLNS